jgi:hypothetical protein
MLLIHFRDDETFEERTGILVNSAYCPVRHSWQMLVSCDDGTLCNVSSSGTGIQSAMVQGFIEEEEEGDD